MSATIAEVLQSCIKTAKVQLLHDCMFSARRVKRTKSIAAHTRVEFATENMTPDDLLYFSGELGRHATRKPQYVGLVVWVPFDVYESATARVAAEAQQNLTEALR